MSAAACINCHPCGCNRRDVERCQKFQYETIVRSHQKTGIDDTHIEQRQVESQCAPGGCCCGRQLELPLCFPDSHMVYSAFHEQMYQMSFSDRSDSD
jgi:hypothetical protein